MLDRSLPAPVPATLGATVCALLAGLLIGLGFWTWALLPAAAAAYLVWEITTLTRSVRSAIHQIGTAITGIPEEEPTRLPMVPSADLVRLCAALEEMSSRVREMIGTLEHDRGRLLAVFTSMRDAVIALNADGRVALVNPAAERLFAVETEEVVGRSVLEVIRHRRLALAMQEALIRGVPHTLEFTTFEVPPRNIQADVAPVATTRGGQSGAVAVLHDVTELRRLERIRSEFVANVSHELRTPITSIKGFLETLLDGAMDDEETRRHFLRILKDEADRLVHLVDDLLELSTLEGVAVAVTRQPLDVLTEANRALELVAPLAAEKGVSTSIEISEGLGVQADRELLRQALLNLLDNAIKYTPAGGRVWVTGHAAGNNEFVEISVHDSGPGIPSEHLERLFERFYRVDKARSRAVGGTGLGLSIVRHICDRLGGRVWAESTLGRGSSFTIALPRSR